MVHIKEPLLLIGKSSPCGGSGFLLSPFEWSFTICLTPYIRKYNVLSVSLNKTLPLPPPPPPPPILIQLIDLTYHTLAPETTLNISDQRERERNVLFNDALNTFYLRLYGVRHMVKDHSDSEKGNLMLPHRLLFPISSKGSFICTIPQTG